MRDAQSRMVLLELGVRDRPSDGLPIATVHRQFAVCPLPGSLRGTDTWRVWYRWYPMRAACCVSIDCTEREGWPHRAGQLGHASNNRVTASGVMQSLL